MAASASSGPGSRRSFAGRQAQLPGFPPAGPLGAHPLRCEGGGGGAAARPPRVLIVEDEPSIALMYRLRLERDGYDVLWEANGRSGLDRVREDPPDLILLDVRLPDIDGFQVLQQITADPGLRAIPVVFLSNLGEPDLVTTGLRLGARDFVIKSKVTPGDLSDLLPNWLPPRPTGA